MFLLVQGRYFQNLSTILNINQNSAQILHGEDAFVN